jgi:hypothetical protein
VGNELGGRRILRIDGDTNSSPLGLVRLRWVLEHNSHVEKILNTCGNVVLNLPYLNLSCLVLPLFAVILTSC